MAAMPFSLRSWSAYYYDAIGGRISYGGPISVALLMRDICLIRRHTPIPPIAVASAIRTLTLQQSTMGRGESQSFSAPTFPWWIVVGLSFFISLKII